MSRRKEDAPDPQRVVIGIAAHPRAARGVRRARAYAGLGGFLLGAYLAHGAGLPAFDVLLRALLAGIGAHVAGWLLAIAYWRAAILAELEAARAHRDALLAEARAAAESRAQAAADTLLRDTAASAGR